MSQWDDRALDLRGDISQPIAIHEFQTALFAALERYTALCTAYRILQADRSHLENNLLIESETGVGTRRAAEETLKTFIAQARRQKTPLTCVLFQLSDPADGEIRAAASAVRASIREGDGIFRWAENEVLLVLPFTSLSQGEPVLARAAGALASLHLQAWQLGIAERVSDEDATGLINRARRSTRSLATS